MERKQGHCPSGKYRERSPEAAKALKSLNPDHYVANRSPEWWRSYNRRQLQVRDARIFRAWATATDKGEEIKRQAEIWGLKPESVASMISTIKCNPNTLSGEARTQVESIRLIQIERIVQNAEAFRCEIEAQITELEEARNKGQTWAAVTMREGSRAYTESTTINDAIVKLHDRILKSYRDEAEALSVYVPKPDVHIQHEVTGQVRHEASLEFKEIFARLESYQKQIPADAEVLDAS